MMTTKPREKEHGSNFVDMKQTQEHDYILQLVNNNDKTAFHSFVSYMVRARLNLMLLTKGQPFIKEPHFIVIDVVYTHQCGGSSHIFHSQVQTYGCKVLIHWFHNIKEVLQCDQLVDQVYTITNKVLYKHDKFVYSQFSIYNKKLKFSTSSL